MRTALYDRHRDLGAKLVDFAGWEMPVHYVGIIAEHRCVREKVGVFDVSHMGRISIHGKEAASFLDYLATNHIAEKKYGTATYTVLCHENGGSVEDAIIYREDENDFFMVANASNRQKDLEHLRNYAKKYAVTIEESFRDEGIVALQGPAAEKVLSKIISDVATLKAMKFGRYAFQDGSLIIARSGYTGEDGFECFGKKELIVTLWDLLSREGKEFGIMPIGLGARDTLRLEKGYALYGHELTDTIAPSESVARWTVKFDKENFLGKEALQKLEKNEKKRSEYGLVLVDKGIPREGYEVVKSGRKIGVVTSGTFSPTLEKGIAIFISSEKCVEGDKVEVKIRDKVAVGEVVNLPFVVKV